MNFGIFKNENVTFHGFRTDIPEEDLIPILESLSLYESKPASSAPATKKLTSSAVVEDKELKALRKKLKQIEQLKEKAVKGQKLQPQQVRISLGSKLFLQLM